MEGVLDDPGSKMIFLGVPGRADIDLEACLFESQRDSNHNLSFCYSIVTPCSHLYPFCPALLR